MAAPAVLDGLPGFPYARAAHQLLAASCQDQHVAAIRHSIYAASEVVSTRTPTPMVDDTATLRR